MKIINAREADFGTVKDITQSTINAVYPHYYPKGAVDFFLAHHSDENIMRDIQNGDVFTMPNSVKMYCPLYPWDVIQRTIVNTSKFFEQDILYTLLKYLPKILKLRCLYAVYLILSKEVLKILMI